MTKCVSAILNVLCIAGMMLIARPATAQVVIWDGPAAISGLIVIRDTGQGWRNLRLLEITWASSGASLPSIQDRIWYVCGHREFFTQAYTDTLEESPFQTFSGLDSREFLEGGYSYRLSEEESSAFIPLASRPAVIAYLARICAAAPALVVEPADFAMVRGDSLIQYLVPSRFGRVGNVVTIWVRTKRLVVDEYQEVYDAGSIARSVQRTVDDGSELQEMVVNCGSGTYAYRQIIRYDARGRVIESTGVMPLVFSETIPGSFGEENVRVICLLE